MNINLASALIEKGVINTSTRILANCPIPAFGGMPTQQKLFLTVNKVVSEDNTLKFVSSHRSGRKFVVPISSIIEIDGMEPDRLGLAYDIKADGLKKPAGKKRGRKPRINTVEQKNGQTQ